MAESQASYTLPASYLVDAAQTAEQMGVPLQELFTGSTFSREDLYDPHVNIPVPEVIRFIESARALTRERSTKREPVMALYCGLRASIAAHGYLGFAVMSARTLGEALQLAIRYAPTRSNTFALHLEVRGTKAKLVMDELADFGSARDVVLLYLLTGTWQIGNMFLGSEARAGTVEVMLSEPRWYASLRDTPPRIRFGRDQNALVFDAALLDAPIATANAASLRLATEQCERLLAQSQQHAAVVERLRRMVLRKRSGVRSFEELAVAMHMSPRTLRRRLAEEGCSYATLVEQERRSKALALLRSPEHSVKEVAERLGYANVANFIRAFRRWTGQTPASYRRGVAGELPRSPAE